MKIVHISTYITGGAGIAAYRLHLNLAKDGEISTYLIQKKQTTEEQLLLNISTAYPKVTLRYRIEKRLKMSVDYTNTRKIINHPKTYDIATFPTTTYRLEELPLIKEADIIHLHWVADFINYPSFFKNIKQPIVWTLHDINPFGGIFHFNRDRLRNINTLGKLDEKFLEKKTKAINNKENIHIVCLSNWMKKQSSRSSAFKRYPHRIIPNGLNFSIYPVLDRLKSKKSLDIDNDLKTILIIGASLDGENKGFPLLFEALNKIEKSEFNFLTVGSYSKKMNFNKKNNHIHFDSINDIAQLNEIYSAADITVLPSREDNLPNVMLESFANGTPVISFSNGGMAEHITTGENGILIEEISSDSLAKAIRSFLDGEYTFDNERIRDYALAHFSEKLQADSYTQLYNDILNNPQP